jgi:hypothetical protein
MPNPVGRREDACYPQDDESLQSESLQSTNTSEVNSDHDAVAESSTASAASRRSARSAASDCDMLPDYLAISGGAALYAGAAATLTVDRYENIYLAGSISIATRGPGGSVMGGYLRDPEHPCDPPSEEKLESFLKGGSRSESFGFGFGAAVTTSGEMRAYEYGLATPQAGVNISHGWLLHDHHEEAERNR